MYLGNADHRRVFEAMVGTHAMPGMDPNNFYAAQVLWDEGMADTAIKYSALRAGSADDVFVVIAGSGHVLYKQGINFRVERRRGGRGITVAMVDADAPADIARGLADFVVVTAKAQKVP